VGKWLFGLERYGWLAKRPSLTLCEGGEVWVTGICGVLLKPMDVGSSELSYAKSGVEKVRFGRVFRVSVAGGGFTGEAAFFALCSALSGMFRWQWYWSRDRGPMCWWFCR